MVLPAVVVGLPDIEISSSSVLPLCLFLVKFSYVIEMARTYA